jgi:anthranilate synthase
MQHSETQTYQTRGGIEVVRTRTPIEPEAAIAELIEQLDAKRGVLLSSSYDYPGRYTRWDMGFVDPPLCFSARGRTFSIEALNARGEVLVDALRGPLERLDALASFDASPRVLAGTVREPTLRFTEEQRSRQPSIFSVLRALLGVFHSDVDSHLGLYGAFGYDLCFQFEPVRLHRPRPATQRDLVLYLPDQIVIVDRQKEQSHRYQYNFRVGGLDTTGLPREGSHVPFVSNESARSGCDHEPGEYAHAVERAKESFRCGDLFEVVLSQTFYEPCLHRPSTLFQELGRTNPAPYALFINLGQSEYLVGASPEMYVRVDGRRVETCPISGTIARGRDPVEDAERIRELLSSKKDESELTMCTDVDRNDKSRICEPGSVKVLGRRQIELYSRLIHTVDHVEGTLRPEFDALDAFLSHTWAVTVTGAPKPAAIQRVESDEKSPRAWYGGAVGVIGFNGNLNTGLTLRTIRIQNGSAEVRAGATLLFDSEPEAEERETRVKASAFLAAVKRQRGASTVEPAPAYDSGKGLRVLLVDHEDSFVHTLANYLRQTGAELVTIRTGFDARELDERRPDLLVLSPGPGTPSDFQLARTIGMALERGIPLFGVCLGLQGIVEYFGGTLGVLDYPMHGKPSHIKTKDSPLFEGIDSDFQAGRYHSLYAKKKKLPDCLKAIAHTKDGVIMAIQHRELPIAAVQFHPESILTLRGNVGLRLLDNAVRMLTRGTRRTAADSSPQSHKRPAT